MELFISKHAKDRFLARGKLYLYPEEITKPYDTIKRLITTGSINLRLEQTPFYKNKVGCKMIINGKFKFYIRDNIVLTCVVMRNKNSIEQEWRF